MEKVKNLSIFSLAEKDQLFEKIFKETGIAVIGKNQVYAASKNGQFNFWIKTLINPLFQNEFCLIYRMGNNYVVYKKWQKDEPLLLVSSDYPTLLLALVGYNFVLKDSEYFYVFTFNEKFSTYKLTVETEIPKILKRHSSKLFVEKEGVDSIDNRIYYNFIKKE